MRWEVMAMAKPPLQRHYCTSAQPLPLPIQRVGTNQPSDVDAACSSTNCWHRRSHFGETYRCHKFRISMPPIHQRSCRACCIMHINRHPAWGLGHSLPLCKYSSNKFCLEAHPARGREEQIRTNCLEPLNFASPPSPSTQPIIQADAKCKLIIS